MLSGSFSGAAQRWAIVEKEAYAIVETCRRADYLLYRQDGFDLFTDHRNLRYILDPQSVVSTVPKYTADKLHRWANILKTYNYNIHDITGEENVWADLLSRWGSTLKAICAIRLVLLPLSPQLNEQFEWPTMAEVVAVQNSTDPPAGFDRSESDSLWRSPEGKIRIPDAAVDLQIRTCFVGHSGVAGHRGSEVIMKQISERFVWKDMKRDTEHFVQRCLHCASTLGGPPQQRLLGEAMHTEHPNELIHWDFLYMGECDTGDTYVLVVKDDASKFVWLVTCKAADADTTFSTLMDWFASFGVC
ncbi:Transposon Tf2-8 polyprotein [Phytophthora citrophthora]|uniref:Transposon Tf2-8 polyprotein n=1 Tax=Phytophthora citrophthora TaxID=4793 RepID=A0AAD9LC74_9STRA|nr:Transposon Tf2-8 polyprotein [Phytophthora citrophthora]